MPGRWARAGASTKRARRSTAPSCLRPSWPSASPSDAARLRGLRLGNPTRDELGRRTPLERAERRDAVPAREEDAHRAARGGGGLPRLPAVARRDPDRLRGGPEEVAADAGGGSTGRSRG